MNIINELFPEIFNFLQETYARTFNKELVEKEDTLGQYVYYPHLPVDKVLTKITLFHDLCTITNKNKTDKQLIQMAYLIFNCTRAFVDTLKKWNAKNTDDKTYSNLKN